MYTHSDFLLPARTGTAAKNVKRATMLDLITQVAEI